MTTNYHASGHHLGLSWRIVYQHDATTFVGTINGYGTTWLYCDDKQSPIDEIERKIAALVAMYPLLPEVVAS